MKKRTFFATLLLFLLFFNAMLLMISMVLLQDKISAAKEKASAEHYVIASALLDDMNALAARGMDAKGFVSERMSAYSRYARNRQNLLAVSYEGSFLYQNQEVLPGDADAFLMENPADGRQMLVVKTSEEPMIYVYGRLPDPFSEYGFLYGCKINSLFSSWNAMTIRLFLAGAAVSLLLALCLLKLLHSVFEPLMQISSVSATIADGDYKGRLLVKGRDEIADMADSFNRMAEQVEKQIALLWEAAQQKQQFVDNFAHELRTPLTAIYGYAEYLQKASASKEERYECTQFIMSECERLTNMAYQLLEMAQLKEASMEECAVEEIFAQSERTMQIKAAEKQVELSYCRKAEYLRGNRELLLSLVNNLTDNAIKASNAGGKICISALEKDDATEISVQDFGIGMNEETLCHITEAFYRADKARSRAAGGAGLGLSICEKIAKLHGAKLSFSSEPGTGTLAIVSFPSNPKNFTGL